MDDLKNNQQITELLNTLEQNGMQKEKGEVQSLVDYIGDMENTLTAMLSEMQEMRKEVNLIHDSTLRAKCSNLVQKADGSIRTCIAAVGKAKDNFIASAANAVKTFKEKGKEAFRSAVKAMKIPETLDKFGNLFQRFASEMRENVQNLESARMEFAASKQHKVNARMLLLGKIPADKETVKNDKGILAKLEVFIGKMARGFSSLETKTNNLADKLRYDRVKESVKADLNFLKGKPSERTSPEVSRDAR